MTRVEPEDSPRHDHAEANFESSGASMAESASVLDRAIDAALDRAARLPERAVSGAVDKVREKNPEATPSEIITTLERAYVRKMGTLGTAAGVAAAWPGLGTVAALGLSGAQFAEFLYESSVHVMRLADVHGVALDDMPRRKALLMSCLLGAEGTALVAAASRESAPGMVGQAVVMSVPRVLMRLGGQRTGAIRALNRRLRGQLAKRSAFHAGRLSVGRLAPFGIGAAIGFLGTRAMARAFLADTAQIFGTPPPAFVRQVGEVHLAGSFEPVEAE